ncbi:MAG TPA: sensor domain-containing protein [Pseudonocardiaceae bacterium]
MAETSRTPHTPLESMARRDFLAGAWPWRSLGYLLWTVPIMSIVGLPLTILALPWFAAIGLERRTLNRPSVAVLLLLVFIGAAMLAAFGPLIAFPLAKLERARLKLVDTRPIGDPHQPLPRPGMWEWLRVRYGEAATWREVGYAILFVTIGPLLYLAVAAFAVVDLVLLASPLLIAHRGPIALGFENVSSVVEGIGYFVLGLLLLPAVPYLFGLLAGAHGATARALLQGADDERLRAELGAVSRSRARLVDAFEVERRRIERDLHDGAQQRLVSLTLKLGIAKLDIPEDSPAHLPVAEAHEQAKALMAELRELIRGLHPRVLTDRGLPAALGELADNASIPVAVDTEIGGRLPTHVEATAYFVVAESLTNVAKHSGATAATVAVRQRSGALTVEVSDNGVGGADPARGSGLTGLADRVAVVNGRMLMSSPIGGPTMVCVELPCQ